MQGECKDCNGKRLAVQRYPASRVPPHVAARPLALDSESTPTEMRNSAPMGLGHNFAQVGLYSSAQMEVTASVYTQKESEQVSQGICDKVRDFVSATPGGTNDCVEDV